MSECKAIVSFPTFIVQVYCDKKRTNPYQIFKVYPGENGEIVMKNVEEYADFLSCLCWIRDLAAPE